ncbi:trans-resveratrol di-O-methyltransferase-like [Gossypium australe]|uniref:Trans-resveratrol di-O-methyltransferase-like n=1 Tax=Gossypium australe TaxID=47621 RepID=A0A5B6WCY6_9ROSI|nr:trans-resveratrol di-O-methyltransferase-like [Gossypium australe]
MQDKKKKKGAGKEAGKKTRTCEWGRNQTGTNDIPSHIQNFHIGRDYSSRAKDAKEESLEEMMGNVHINAIHEETAELGTLSGICPYQPGSVLDNWTAEEIPIVFRAYTE